MQRLLPRVPLLHLASLRSKLFASFVGVLLLSLILTAASFWVQIQFYDTQQVRSDLQTAAPVVFTNVKNRLVGYWQTAPQDSSELQTTLAALKAQLSAIARGAAVRVLLTDNCNRIAIDTGIPGSPQLLGRQTQVAPTCSPVLDDLGGSQRPAVTLDLGLSNLIQQTNSLPGADRAFYLARPAPSFLLYATQRPGGKLLHVRAIIVAKSPGPVDQHALSEILPRLLAAGAIAVLLTLLVVVLIVGAITRPLRTIMAASERMAGGDYDQRVPDAGPDEIGQLARSFNRMASEVSTARELQRQFIANISHDLKTPLTSILGFSQILADSEEVAAAPIQQRAVQVINEEARRLRRLTQDLLDLSRLEAGQLQLRHEPCDLNDLAGTVLARYADLPANASLIFQDQRCVGALPVWGDPDRLMQVLVNLVDNAVKFCNPGGCVAVQTMCQGLEAVLIVANTGVGIAQEDLARVFQRFYRTDHSRAARTGGTGLGLAIVWEIIAAHGGHVEARSEIDGWTRFTVSLPVLPNPPPGLTLR